MSAVIVAGAIANKPRNGGAAWVLLSWLLGLRKLGFDVWFIEELAKRDPAAEAWLEGVMSRFGLGTSSVLICEGEIEGPDPQRTLEVADDAQLLINISGHLTFKPLLDRVKTKVFVDLDPGVTQLWHAAGVDGDRLAAHDFYFTVGANVGGGSPIPTNGLDWKPMLPPCVLSDWPVMATAPAGRDRFTTVATWRGPYARVEYEGRTYGIKLDEFRKFACMPQKAPGRFELALDIHPAEERDRALLNSNGWKVVDPFQAAGDPDSFRDYVQHSGAEFSVAQGIYVETESGWFSDRTTRYLSAGKPALIQDTGFSRHLPTGEGLLAFSTLQEAVAGAKAILRDYDAHAQAARAVAVEHFDSDKVLGRLLDEVGI